MDWDFWILVATIASPITGVIAIIVALALSRSSSRDAQKQIDAMRQSTKEQIDAIRQSTNEQIDAMRNILDVFVASQAPNMIEALRKYKQQLKDVEEKISDAKDEFSVSNPFYGRGPKIEDIEYERTKRGQAQNIAKLEQQREAIKKQIDLIQAFLDKEQ